MRLLFDYGLNQIPFIHNNANLIFVGGVSLFLLGVGVVLIPPMIEIFLPSKGD